MIDGIPLVEFMNIVFTRITGETYGRRFRSLFLCVPVTSLINSLRFSVGLSSEHRFPEHLPPNSAKLSGYANEECPLFISAQLFTDAVSALRKVWVLITLEAT